MQAAALFTPEEQTMFSGIYREAVGEYGDVLASTEQADEEGEAKRISLMVLNRVQDLVKRNHVDGRTATEINALQQVGGIPSILLQGKTIEVDRGCNVYSNPSLRKAVVETYADIAKTLGMDVVNDIHVASDVPIFNFQCTNLFLWLI